MYKITCTYDEDTTPKWIGHFSDALTAVHSFDKFVDFGFANKYATVNLLEPSGKLHTKVFYREGNRVISK